MLALRSQAPGSPGQAGRDDGLLSPPWKEDARNGCSSWEQHEGVSPRAATQGWRGGGSTKDPLSNSKQATRGRSHVGCSGRPRRSPAGKGHKGPLQQQLARGSSQEEGARRGPQVPPWCQGRQVAH